ncbi:DNA polymerase III subunit chi [Zooshikella ganghwensis]|uniref:DNA polymerase III subunit chi n=1 Tax=Zooshikella ganghwensis TaxID=202772 RepID=A0A4P9VLF9_9GAMM|nr:DNA polymerase III subunit chi [Zooshikella ganghwensis]RDH42950.1 DNA polymerase III subunit chi [Zooshikella ganghwensis]
MPRVDFYIVQGTTQDAQWQFACRLIEKAYKMGHYIYAHLNTQADAQLFDQLLWSFRPDSFIPHHILDAQSPRTKDNKVAIGWQNPPHPPYDVLINLANTIPEAFSHFNRVSEIVYGHEESRKNSRKNFMIYRESGYPLHTHDLRKTMRE